MPRTSHRPDCADDLDSRYLFEINARWTIDGSNRRNRARYINHSCRPNAEAYFVKHVIKIRAIKAIEPGDEITYNYGKAYFETFIEPVGCKCSKCRSNGNGKGGRHRKLHGKKKANGKRSNGRA